MAEHEALHIAEVADSVGLSLRSLRLYDEAGLAPPSSRDGDGAALYGRDDVDRLRLLKRLKPLDLDLEELGEVVGGLEELAADGTGPERRRELVELLAHFVSLAEERAAHLRHELAELDATTVELRNAVLRGRSALHHHPA